MTTTHACPGGCGARVGPKLFACNRCWFRLPLVLRTRIWITYEAGPPAALQHREAMRDGALWYGANPRPRRGDVVWHHSLRGRMVHALAPGGGATALCGVKNGGWSRSRAAHLPECKRCLAELRPS